MVSQSSSRSSNPAKEFYIRILAIVLSLLLTSCHTEHGVRSRVLRLESSEGACSGTQVTAPSGKSYVLSAAHCAVLAGKDGTINVSYDGSRPIPRRVLEVSHETDLMLVEGLPNLSGLSLGSEPKRGDTLTSYTHGFRYETYKDEGELVETHEVEVLDRILTSPLDEAQCTAEPKFKVMDVPVFFGLTVKACMLVVPAYVTTMKTIVPGSSGGTVVDSSGNFVGVAFASNQRFAMVVPFDAIKKFLEPY